MNSDPIVIAGYARTPIGSFQGALAPLSCSELGAIALRATIDRTEINADDIDDVIMGCVLAAGLGQAPARQASIKAGISKKIGATTINKMCGSGMKAIMFAHDLILAGTNNIALAGGMESMSNAPYLLPKARDGYRMGHNHVLDSMFYDGLEDAYDKGKLMGVFAENTAQEYGFSRQAQDEFAISSLQRASNAISNGFFKQEIAPVVLATRNGEVTVSDDEQPSKARPDKIPQLRPAFAKDGTVTAANSSSISDGAAAVMLMKKSEAEKRGLAIYAIIHGHATHAAEPSRFTTAPVGAVEKLLAKVDWDINSVDRFEINEAFAVVTMAAIHDLKLDREKVNVHGGACALGHPIGASGARVLVTLLASMAKDNLKRGVAALCIGGGEATAIGIERVA